MRYVYIDEAGTTNEDPLTVVVGVVVEADASYQLLERKLAEITNTVPVKLRAGFVSHALDIWNNKRIREDWPFDQRLAFLKSMMSIGRSTGFGLSVAFARLGNVDPQRRMPSGEFRHQLAFGHCIAFADRFICEQARPDEVVTVVAEDCPERRGVLRAAVKSLRNSHPTRTGLHLVRAQVALERRAVHDFASGQALAADAHGRTLKCIAADDVTGRMNSILIPLPAGRVTEGRGCVTR